MVAKKFKCRFCGKIFTKNSNKDRHTKLNRCLYNPNPRNIKPRCIFCNTEFSCMANYDLHISRRRCPNIQQQQPPQPQPEPQPQPQPQIHPQQEPVEKMENSESETD